MSSKTFNNTKINVEFDEDYQSRTNINSGENISSLFAKIRRFILDLKSVAFSGSYNDLSDTPTTATKDTDGLMSAEDKGKLDAFEITTTGGKLHDKDIATTDLIPTELPANGGNADTVDGLHANDFTQIIDFGFSETDTKTAIGQPCKTTIYRCVNWTDCPSEFIDSQGTLITINYAGSGTVGTDRVWCTQIIVSPRSGNKMFIRYIDSTSVSDWKEISTTPIKSVQVGGTTNEYGNFLLWDGENNKIPICVESNGYHAYTYMMNVIYSDNTTKKMYFISMDNSGTPVQNKSVTATVYYIEI